MGKLVITRFLSGSRRHLVAFDRVVSYKLVSAPLAVAADDCPSARTPAQHGT
jgi:hypothetical protein